PTVPEFVVCTALQAASSTLAETAPAALILRINVLPGMLVLLLSSELDRAGSARRAGAATLPSVAQCMIHQHDSQQGFGDRRGAYAHARIMAPQGLHLNRLPIPVYGLAFYANAGCRLDGNGNRDGLTG